MKYAVIMQARMNSSRLKGKVLKELKGKTVLAHDIERIRQAKKIDGIIIATTENPEDEPIVSAAKACGVPVFRGSEEDVLSRYYYAAVNFQVEHIIRITSDCPLVDPHIIDEVIACYQEEKPDIITNVPNEWEKMTYPRGLDLEIFPFEWLERAFREAGSLYDREHVSPYIYDHAKNRFYYRYKTDYSRYRWTLDTPEDWEVIENIYGHFYHGTHDFYFEEIVKYMEEHPEVAAINQEIRQKIRRSNPAKAEYGTGTEKTQVRGRKNQEE